MSEALDPIAFLFAGPGGAKRHELLSRLRRLQRGDLPEDGSADVDARCELCGRSLSSGHRHLLQTAERRILCTCVACWVERSGDADHRCAGSRTIWFPDVEIGDATWARLAIPIGLAFFLHSSAAQRVIALYPSAAGAAECELELAAWNEIAELDPRIRGMEPDAEALLVNRLDGARDVALVPIDEAYALIGRIRVAWQGVSGGDEVMRAVRDFMAEVRVRSSTPVVAPPMAQVAARDAGPASDPRHAADPRHASDPRRGGDGGASSAGAER